MANAVENVITIRYPSLLLLIGPAASGKTTFARKHFKPTEILSSDFLRGMLTDDENNQAISGDVFALLHWIASKRLAQERLTVIDATNVERSARKQLLDIARKQNCPSVAIVFNLPEGLLLKRNLLRPERRLDPEVNRRQGELLQLSLVTLPEEGFDHVYELSTPEQIDKATVQLSEIAPSAG